MWAVWGLGSCASIWGFIRPFSIWGLASCVSIWFFVSSHMLVHHSASFCMESVECNLNWSRISWSAAEYRCLAWNANLYYWCLACNAWNKLSLQVRDRDKRERNKVKEVSSSPEPSATCVSQFDFEEVNFVRGRNAVVPDVLSRSKDRRGTSRLRRRRGSGRGIAEGAANLAIYTSSNTRGSRVRRSSTFFGM